MGIFLCVINECGSKKKCIDKIGMENRVKGIFFIDGKSKLLRKNASNHVV